MNKQTRVVVVDDNEAVIRSVKEYFKNSSTVKVVSSFNNGRDALDYLLEEKNAYDMLIIDVFLSHYDGLKILEELNTAQIKKQIIVLSSFKDDFTIRKAQFYGANYFMLKPVNMEVIEERICDLMEEKDEVALALVGKMELKVSTLLHDLGIPSHIKGYKYIREGILLLYSTDEVTTLVTKTIYPAIATKFDTTTSRVERAIRHAIEVSWARGDLKLMEEIFGNSIDFDRSRPTNSEFLTTIADRFKINDNQFVM